MTPEPITPGSPVAIRRPLLVQGWADLTFVHWTVDPDVAAGLMPAGVVPDVLDGVTYAGLVAFRVHRTGLPRLPAVPYLGAFPETNVRLYSVDAEGRRGVVFRSMDAARLLPVLAGRLGLRLPYVWSRMDVRAVGDTIRYTGTRRRPGPRRAHSRITVRPGRRIEEPTDLDHFLTARWGMHNDFRGTARYLPNDHPRWPLHHAELLECDESLLTAAGLPAPAGEPASVLYSPGVMVRFGRPGAV